MHWCKSCSIFPKTAREYLEHLHSAEHKSTSKAADTPWHQLAVCDDFPNDPKIPKQRIPIKGLQFFVPSTAWFCKLCSFWIGDLRTASTHLKSQTHSKEYEKFVQKNTRFESEWLAEREKAYEQHRNENKQFKQDRVQPSPPPPPTIMKPSIENAPSRIFDSIPLQINQRAIEKPKDVSISEESVPVPAKKGKKKKKEKKKKKKSKKKHHRSSSSSSSSSSDDSSASEVSKERKMSVSEQPIDTSTSIRVAMRNSLQQSRTHMKPKSDDEETNVAGGWTVVQEPKLYAPQAPTISANGEAQNRRDEIIIQQWNEPQPVISQREKQLFEQLKGRFLLLSLILHKKFSSLNFNTFSCKANLKVVKIRKRKSLQHHHHCRQCNHQSRLKAHLIKSGMMTIKIKKVDVMMINVRATIAITETEIDAVEL